MKLVIFNILVLVVVNYATFAQEIPNPGFEIWSTDGPYQIADGWTNSNEITFQLNSQISAQSSANAYDGNLSAILYTGETGGLPYPGWIVNGIPHLNYSSGEIDFFTAGTDFHLKPQSFTGYYRYENNYVSTDSAHVLVYLKKFDYQTGLSDTIALGYRKLGPSAIFQHFEVPLFDLRPEILPDSMVIGFTSTDINLPMPGGALWIDKLNFIDYMNHQENEVPNISIFPNPASDFITVTPKGISKTLKVNVYNSLGKLVRLCRINDLHQSYKIKLKGLDRGVYFVKVFEGKNEIETKKLIIQD